MMAVPATLWTSIVTILAILVYFFTSYGVARMRGKHGIKAPAMDGHPEFERAVRVQMNTLEAMPIFLVLLWMATIYSPAPVLRSCRLSKNSLPFKRPFGRLMVERSRKATWREPALSLPSTREIELRRRVARGVSADCLALARVCAASTGSDTRPKANEAANDSPATSVLIMTSLQMACPKSPMQASSQVRGTIVLK